MSFLVGQDDGSTTELVGSNLESPVNQAGQGEPDSSDGEPGGQHGENHPGGSDHGGVSHDASGGTHGGAHGSSGGGMDIQAYMAHVQDAYYFEVPHFMAGSREAPEFVKHAEPDELQGKLLIPQPFGTLKNLHESESGFLITKFMVVQLVVVLMLIVAFTWLASKIRTGKPVTGKLANMLEAMLLFIRDNVARPAIGAHDGDRFLPFLWTLFFFIVTCNVVGMVPWVGTATGILATTAALAGVTFLVVVLSGMMKLGAVGFWKAQVPHMDLPHPVMSLILKPLVFGIEVGGLFIKHTVLAVRLLANMFAGHLVLAVIIGFISQYATSGLWYGIVPASILGSVALGLLELFVAFLQAYIFTFLAALFIGMAVHPH
ncbi:MAG: F0F1 ATP synthase subunit A [Pirellulales bacterium]|nr:F0F1 ATP synthase subunit A [Pirellulales bacterium]